MTQPIDYAKTGLTIGEAMIDLATKYPDKAARSDYIIWGGLSIKTADWFPVPTKGLVKIEILSKRSGIDQAIDVDVENGVLYLADGKGISLLRTWADDRYEDTVEYPYESKSGRLCVWNVYRLHFPNGQFRDEKWTGNSGFWVEVLDDGRRIYHCSYGLDPTPDFEALVFRVTITADQD